MARRVDLLVFQLPYATGPAHSKAALVAVEADQLIHRIPSLRPPMADRTLLLRAAAALAELPAAQALQALAAKAAVAVRLQLLRLLALAVRAVNPAAAVAAVEPQLTATHPARVALVAMVLSVSTCGDRHESSSH